MSDEEGMDHPGGLETVLCPRKPRVSRITEDILRILGSTPESKRKSLHKDVSELLEPLRLFAKVLSNSIDNIMPTSNAAENFLMLRLEVQEKYPTAVGAPTLANLFAAWEIPLVKETPDCISAEAVQEELVLIQDAIWRKVKTWDAVFPRPPADLLRWPDDFCQEERSQIRKFVKNTLGESLATPFGDKNKLDDAIQIIIEVSAALETEFPVPRAIGCSDAVIKAIILAVKNDESRRKKAAEARQAAKRAREQEENKEGDKNDKNNEDHGPPPERQKRARLPLGESGVNT